MKRIEFIGAPAIGKSTVLKQVMQQRKQQDTWLTAREARIQVAKNIKNKKVYLGKVLQSLLTLNVMRMGHNRMATMILKDYEDEIMDHLQGEYTAIASVFLDDLWAEKQMNAIQKLQMNEFYFDLLFQELMTLEYFQVQDLIVCEEGIIHNNSAFRSEEKTGEVLKHYRSKSSFVVPSGVVYCHMEEREYIARRKERIAQGKGLFLDRTLNDEELEKICLESLNQAEETVKVLKKFGIPVLEVDMNKPVQENTEHVYRFICRHQ